MSPLELALIAFAVGAVGGLCIPGSDGEGRIIWGAPHALYLLWKNR